VTLDATGGNCSEPLCPSAQVARGTPVVCNITCTEGTTAVVPTLQIDDLPPRQGSSVATTYKQVNGTSSCVALDSPFLYQYGPVSGERGAWLAKTLCNSDLISAVTKTITVSTSVPDPAPDQCQACAATYPVTASATLSIGGKVSDQGDATVLRPCPVKFQCNVTASLDVTLTRDWQWCA
jgi:hypothetical protein